MLFMPHVYSLIITLVTTSNKNRRGVDAPNIDIMPQFRLRLIPTTLRVAP